MYNGHSGLLFALFFFCVALFFFLMCITVKGREARLLAFWYAVVFEFAGFFSLAVQAVTS